MQPAIESELRARALAAVRAGEPALGDAERASPVSRYLDPARFEIERERIFARVPRLLGHAAELPEPGSFLTAELAGRPVLAVRGSDGVARAFLNVCRHRGTRLVDAAQGCEKRFTCPYHAWTYGLDGALVGVPGRERGFPDLDRERSGLVGLPLAERHGLLWTNLDRDSALDVPGFLGALDDDLAGMELSSLEPYEPFRQVYATNWKLLVEGGLEAYHFPVAHRRTIAPLFEGSIYIADRVGPHFRTVLPKKTLREAPKAEPLRAHANILYSLFPSAAFILQADHVAFIRFRPLAVDRSEVDVTLLVPRAPRSEKAERYWSKNRQLTTETLDEDFAIAASIQSTLASGANEALRFGRFEHLLGQLHEVIDAHLEA